MAMKGPELLIGYGENGNPVSAACSLCGDWMPEDYSPSDDPHEVVARFAAHFKIHVQREHPIQPVN